ncbi:hypothetical protein D3C78_1418950 [compost metagenome]
MDRGVAQQLVQGFLQRLAEEGRGGLLAVDPVFLRYRGGGDSRLRVSPVSDANADHPLACLAHRKAFHPVAGAQELLPAGAGWLYR